MSIMQLLLKYNRPTPRYTSYPTAPEWENLTDQIYQQKLKALTCTDAPISLYFHIPFCKTMCLYCGCSVVLNRKPENEETYVNSLCKEIDLVCTQLGKGRHVTQLHFGGGTPTKLSISLLAHLFEKIDHCFFIDYTKEVSIEIDPRTVAEDQGEKLSFLRSLGFNRVSFGVQDTNPQVQEAIKRRQSLEMTIETYKLARALGFQGINIDLIYGLPFQTPQSFETTTEHILKMKPDRIALFSYAKVPWLKPHQKAIQEAHLPTLEQKFKIYAEAREAFVRNGYLAIGMDHFALKNDDLAKAYGEKKLQRNFQGYSLKLAEDLLSFGITSIGYVGETYFQNMKGLIDYYQSINQGKLPIHRGKILHKEDVLRKWVIHTLMCDFELDKLIFYKRFAQCFDEHFKAVKEQIDQHEADGLLVNTPEKIIVSPLGELFIRTIASTFDAYLIKPISTPQFSQAV